MNNREITVDFVSDNDEKKLVFNFDEKISLNLTSDNVDELKAFFTNLLKELVSENFTIKFNEQDIENDLFYDVATKYISHLKVELEGIKKQKLMKIDEISEE